MLRRLIASGVVAAAMGSFGIRTTEKLEKKIAGGRALSVRGLMARRAVMAAAMQMMKQDREQRG